jgi:crescentin
MVIGRGLRWGAWLMSKLSELFGRKGGAGGEGHSNGNGHKRVLEDIEREIEPETPSDVSSRIGEENEALRNLLFDTGRKINELDELKIAFEKIVDPFNNALRALEQEKSHNLSLNGQLQESRAAADALRAQFYTVEKKATLLQAENERLRENLELARETARALETQRNDLSQQITNHYAHIGELERELAHETSQRKALTDNKQSLTEQLDAAEKRNVMLDGDLAAARERIAMLEDEKQTLQSSLEQSLAEISRLTRRHTETDNALAANRAQLARVEGNFGEAHADRARLSAALDESREQQQAERNSLNMRLEALQSRATTAEKLLAEARQTLIARTEEVRAFDRKAVEATIVKNNAEKRLAQIEASHETRERQIKDLEQSRAALVERANALTKTVKSRETALARAEERLASLTERTAHLEADIQANRSNVEKRVEDLNTSLQRERMERAVVEGALEAARKDSSRLQSEVAAVRATLRRGGTLFRRPGLGVFRRRRDPDLRLFRHCGRHLLFPVGRMRADGLDVLQPPPRLRRTDGKRPRQRAVALAIRVQESALYSANSRHFRTRPRT